MLSCPMSCLGSSCRMPCRMRFRSSCWCCCCRLSPCSMHCRSSGHPCSAESRRSFGWSRSFRIVYRRCSKRNRCLATDQGWSRKNRWVRSWPVSRSAGFAIYRRCPRLARSCATIELARGAHPDPLRRW